MTTTTDAAVSRTRPAHHAPIALPSLNPPVHNAPSHNPLVRARRRSGGSAVLAAALTGAAGLAAVAGVVALAPALPSAPMLHDLALLAHLACLALGFGAVLLLDLTGVRWVLGRATLADTARLAHLAHPAIWLGMTGLVISGALLHPDPTSSLTQAKLLAVVLACANGGYATHLGGAVADAARHSDRLPRGLMVRGLLASAVSQAAWWTALVVGWLNARS